MSTEAPEVEVCGHARGFECDGFFHFCRACGYPLDDCDCPGERAGARPLGPPSSPRGR